MRPPADAAHSANAGSYPDVITCAAGTLEGDRQLHLRDRDQGRPRDPPPRTLTVTPDDGQEQGLRRSSSRSLTYHPMARCLQRRHRPERLLHPAPPPAATPPSPDNIERNLYAITPSQGTLSSGRPTTRSASPPAHSRPYAIHPGRALGQRRRPRARGSTARPSRPRPTASAATSTATPPARVTVTGAAACTIRRPLHRERGHLPRRHHLCPGHPRDPANYTFATGTKGNLEIDPADADRHPRTTARSKVYGAARARSLT